uniref:Cell cycle regulator of NHEJ n=1 Tax=Gallus gallus TaxID=9031 RepID=A0A8V0YFQ4_CHICK
FCVVVVFHKKKILPLLLGGERVGGAGAQLAASCPVVMPRAATVYCMNEAELVEVALGVLAEARRGGPLAWPCVGTADGPCVRACSARDAEEGSDGSPGPPSPPGAGAEAERTGLNDSEDDALKYVREIFFT